ncbi:glutamine synthetase family protein [Pseudohalocynthiibacter sp. F2068]|jgi:glutamine synthetase|uniref:glutamine synthetase family protein n=1 Tax=Pseudohalocynthiibacter sp. F2068 TaxID=2926418 RepID=UPI001FF5E96C|nr:glutamine synthetase family protein [Pseudohalocynthiibacter sp. F2068]MCK0103026.1 glutamine synthetase family protein [Pseudohalocynthiibacter sp. F2068]
MSDFQAEYDAYCNEYGTPDRIEMMLCDLNAVLRGKWLPGDEVDKLINGGVRLPMSTYAPNILGSEVEATGLGITIGDPDGFIVPVDGTLKPVPWANGNVAQVLVEMVDEDCNISSISTRNHLRNVIDRFEKEGLHPVVATELEFYIVKRRDDSSDAPSPPDGLPDAQNYDLEVLNQSEAILTEILETSKAQGLATDALIAEYGPGQFEINFHHTDDVLAAADTALMFKRLVIGIVDGHGLEATFMAKPYAEEPGNGMHVHASVVDDDGNNIFASENDEDVSPRLKAAVAGVLGTMRDMQAIFAPHMNSYRRFQPNSFAPSAPDWGLDHRGAAIRLPEISGPGARLEHRISGADVNPYLVLAAILGGIHYGLHHECDLPLPLEDDKSSDAEPLTHDWTTAVALFEESDFAKDLFGEDYQKIYTAVRRDEIKELTSIITAVEYRYYLSRL